MIEVEVDDDEQGHPAGGLWTSTHLTNHATYQSRCRGGSHRGRCRDRRGRPGWVELCDPSDATRWRGPGACGAARRGPCCSLREGSRAGAHTCSGRDHPAVGDGVSITAEERCFPGGRWTSEPDTEVNVFLGSRDEIYPKPDGKLTFDKLSSVFLSGNHTRDNAPDHIRLQHTVPVALARYWESMCPAQVYEIPEDEAQRAKRAANDEQTEVTLTVTPSNCVQCGAITARGGRLTRAIVSADSLPSRWVCTSVLPTPPRRMTRRTHLRPPNTLPSLNLSFPSQLLPAECREDQLSPASKAD
jgi:NAD-dependent dihydropyrimidine dehydrogenase PreA subunit